MKWVELTTLEQVEEANELSFSKPVLVYKHSTRCSISAAALGRLERKWREDNELVPYFIDVIKDRNVSNAVAARYHVEHESPQILFIRNGKCEFSRSHMAINPEELTV